MVEVALLLACLLMPWVWSTVLARALHWQDARRRRPAAEPPRDDYSI